MMLNSKYTNDHIPHHLRSAHAQLIQNLAQSVHNPQTLTAMRMTPRHCFVADAWEHRAYDDVALPISQGQTISRPHIVAHMTARVMDYLSQAPCRMQRVLEIGGGCGYQAAILAHGFAEVYSLEVDEILCAQSAQRLAAMGYHNIQLRCGDGWYGWPQAAPFDAVVISCGVHDVTRDVITRLRTLLAPLFAQLGQLSCLIVPAGHAEAQRLYFFTRQHREWEVEITLPVRFVPFVSKVLYEHKE